MDLRSRENSRVNSFFINCLITWRMKTKNREGEEEKKKKSSFKKKKTKSQKLQLSDCVWADYSLGAAVRLRGSAKIMTEWSFDNTKVISGSEHWNWKWNSTSVQVLKKENIEKDFKPMIIIYVHFLHNDQTVMQTNQIWIKLFWLNFTFNKQSCTKSGKL